MNLAYLILGSNLGDKLDALATASNQIEQHCGIILKKSPLYETAAWGNTDQPSFANQVLLIRTQLSARDLLHAILSIEKEMGRVRTIKYAARIIDIDILFFNHDIIQEPNLVIPHPEIANRKFVLLPLAAIVPNKIHPVYKKTIRDLLQQCTDKLEVTELK